MATRVHAASGTNFGESAVLQKIRGWTGIASAGCALPSSRSRLIRPRLKGVAFMRVAFLLLLVAALLTRQPATTALLAQEPGSPAASVLDFEFFRTKVQPIFLAKREGHTRCVSCHSKGTPMRLEALSPGAATWTEEQSRKNFQIVRTKVVPYNLLSSRLLLQPLASEGGGTFYHSGGKHWNSFLDPEWQTLANWVCGRKATEKMVESTGSCVAE